VKERLKLQNLRIHHVMIRSELKYLIGGKIVNLKRRVFGGKTGPIGTVRVFVWKEPLQWFGSSSNPIPEPFLRVGTVANTNAGFIKALRRSISS
jgi:hypothetical protein